MQTECAALQDITHISAICKICDLVRLVAVMGTS